MKLYLNGKTVSVDFGNKNTKFYIQKSKIELTQFITADNLTLMTADNKRFIVRGK